MQKTAQTADEFWGDGKDVATATKAAPSADEFWGPSKAKPAEAPGLMSRARAMLTDAVSSVEPAPAGERKRGGLRSEAKPYVAGDERVTAKPATKPAGVLEQPYTGPDAPFTEAEGLAGEVAPWKRAQDAAQIAYRSGAGAPVATEPGISENISAGLRDLTKNPVARGAAAGFTGLAQTGIGAVRGVADAVGADGVADFAGGASKIADNVGKGATQDLKGNDKLIADIGQSILVSTPALALGTVGGPALKALFAQSALAEYNQGRNAGFAAPESATRAGIMGAAEAIGERFGLPEQIKLIKSVGKHLPTDQLAQVFGSMLAKEIPGEQLTTAIQFLADKEGPAALQPNATLADYLNQAGETLKVTIGQTAVMGGGPAVAGMARNSTKRADEAVNRSTRTPAENAMGDSAFMRPAQRRAETLSRLDDLAAEHGIPTKVVAKIKEAAEGKPLADLGGWMKRAIGNLGQKGVIRPLDDAALSVLDEQPAEIRQVPAEIRQESGKNPAGNQALDAASILDGEDAPPEPTAPQQPVAGENPAQVATPEGDKGPAPIEGDRINRNWSTFSPDSGTLGIPRSDMPQIAATDRGAFVNFMNARGVQHQTAELPSTELKPTQAEFSPSKVANFKAGGGRSILVSNDGYVIDGHHQWVASREQGEPVKAIVLDAPVQDVLRMAHQFPSSFTAKGPSRDSGNGSASTGGLEGTGPADGGNSAGVGALVPSEQPQPVPDGTAGEPVPVADASGVPGAAGPERGDKALKPGQSVTLEGQTYTVKAASPTIVRLTGPDGKVRPISSTSTNWAKIQPVAEAEAPPKPTGKPAEVFAGQHGEGMAEHVANSKAREFKRSRPDMTWTVAETEGHKNPKLKPGRYVLEGRPVAATPALPGKVATVADSKPAARAVEPSVAAPTKEDDATQASQATAPRGSGEAGTGGVSTTGTTAAAEAVGVKKQKQPKGKKHPREVRGSEALAEISRRLNGISPSLLADLSQRVARTRTNAKTGKVSHYTTYDNPMVTGVGPLFRAGGSSDLTEFARVLEDAGFMTPGSLEDDYGKARNEAQDIIKRELNQGGSTLAVGNPDAVEAEMQRRAEMAMDREVDPWEDYMDSPDDMELAGAGEYDAETQELASRLANEAAALGIDVDALREDFFDRADPNWSQKDYDKHLIQAFRDAIAQVGRTAEQGNAGPTGQGDEGSSQAGADQAGAGSDRADGPDQAVQAEGLTLTSETEAEAQAKADREAKALADERAKKEADRRRAEADAMRDEFTLVGSQRTADVAMAAGQGGLFDAPAEPAQQVAAILDAAADPPKGKERLDVLKDVKAGAITPEEVAAAYPAAEAEAKNDRDHFTLDRVDQDTGRMGLVTFQRGQRVKVANFHPMKVGILDGISHAERKAAVDGMWTDFGYIYPETYDEFKQHRESVSKQLANISQRLDDDNAIEATNMLRAARQEAEHYKIIGEFRDQIERLQQQAADVEAANAERFRSQREASIQRGNDAPQPARDPIKMTMEEWKAVHKDFKGTLDGVRTVMREGGMMVVEIVKPGAESDRAAEKPADILAAEEALWTKINAGTATVEEFRAGFERWVAGKEEATAMLAKKTKADLLKMGGGMFAYRYKSETKPEIVEALWREGASTYVLGRSYSYGMSGSQMEAIRRMVEATDADQLAQYAKDRKAAEEDAVARVSRTIEAIKDPKTLSDYQTWMRSTMSGGKTFKEARMMLTPEQRAAYDELAATESRGNRKNTEDIQRSQVRVAGQVVDGEIVATKHTKHGYDLFVVRLAERVSKEDYDTLNTGAKRLGGGYSSFRGGGAVPGFQFRTRDAAEAFQKLAAGDNSAAVEAAKERRDAFADDRSQTAVERLTEMATRLEDRADEAMSRDRKANTERRARFAASAEASARADKAMAKTMRNLAGAIQSDAAKFLDRVRQKAQVELLQTYVQTAQGDELRAKFPSYADQERNKGAPPTAETADFAEFPSFTAYRSDLASLGRQLLEVDGTKKMGERIMKVADDVSDAYLTFSKENFGKVATFSTRDGGVSAFGTKDAAQAAINRSGYKGRAIAYQVKRGEHAVIMSPSEAMSRGIWKGDGDKRITLTADFGAELVENIGKVARRGAKVSVPWQFETAYNRRKSLARMGIETPAEFRAALREFIALREQPAEADKIKAMERAMIGRRNDGMDFFPTPESVADEMVAAADIQPGMRVLEPSAGMGHIAERIRATEVDPDVIEISGDRRELLEAKGFNVVASDFTGLKLEDLPDGEGYDRIIMNPPFSDGRDIQHVRHAYLLLKPGGRLVAIMGESAFTNQNKRATEFRDWLDQIGGTDEKLAEGTFNDPTLPVNTGANARMVVIDKPGGVAMLSRPEDSNTEGIPATTAQAIADTLTANSFKVRALASRDDLPPAQLAEVKTIDPEGIARGAFTSDGSIWLFANNLASPREALEVALHEGFHRGLRLLGEPGAKLLRQVYATNAKVRKLADAYQATYKLDREDATNEALADLAGKGEAEGLNYWHSVKTTIRDWLRKLADALGVDMTWTDADIARMVAGMSRKGLTEGAHVDGGGEMSRPADQTQTAAFRKWFGDSRVVDDKGQPLVVYHGTNKTEQGEAFTMLDAYASNYGLFGQGAYLTADPSVASEYTSKGRGDGPSVYPLYASIKNPIDMDAEADPQKWIDAYQEFDIEAYHEEGITNESYYRAAEEAARDEGMEKWEGAEAMQDGLRRMGFDGITHIGGGRVKSEGKKHRVFIAFDPEQIKSAIGNSGTYDPNNPSILLSRPAPDTTGTSGPSEAEAVRKGYKARVQSAIARVDAVMNGMGHASMGEKLSIDGTKQSLIQRLKATTFSDFPDSEQFMAQRYRTLGKIAKVDKVAGDIRAAFRKATADEKKVIYAYLTTAGATADAIGSTEVRDMAVNVKGYINTVGDALVQRGLLPDTAREEYRDRYLPRMYLAHLLDEGDWRAVGAGKKVSDMGYLKARKDIPQEIRDVLLGEVKDPAFLAATAIAKPMRDMALLDWLEQISANEKWIHPNAVADWGGKRVSAYWLKAEATALRARARLYPEQVNKEKAMAVAEAMDALAAESMAGLDLNNKDYKQIPDTARYGRLRGLLVRREIYDDLMGAQDFMPKDPGWAQQLLGYGGVGTKATQLWKMSKVALNPPGQIRNIVGNAVMLQLSGVPLHKFPALIGRTIMQIKHNGTHWKVAQKYGVTESTFQAQELFRSRRDLLDLEREVKGMTPWNAIKTTAAVIGDLAGDAYQASEALFKTMKIMDGMERLGLTEEQAALEAQRWLFDYSLLNRNLRYARNAPVGAPFVTFTSKVMPRLAEVALLHPQRFLPWVALMYGLQAWAQASFGGDDDEWEKLKEALPKWMQEKGHIAFLPFRDDAGRLQAVDLSYFFPWTQWVEAAKKAGTGDVLGASGSLGIFGGPIPSIITAATTGVDPFTDRSIIKDGDPPAYKAAAITAYVWDMAMPPFISSNGVVSPMWLLGPEYGGKLAQATTGATNRVGDEKSTMGQAASRFVGLNVYGIDPEVTRAANLQVMSMKAGETVRELRRKLSNQGLTEAQRAKIIADFQAEVQKRSKEAAEYADKSEVPEFARKQPTR